MLKCWSPPRPSWGYRCTQVGYVLLSRPGEGRIPTLSQSHPASLARAPAEKERANDTGEEVDRATKLG